MADLDALLAALRELGPVAGDGRVQVELASVGQHQGAQRRHGLGRRPDVDDRVALPRLRARLVDMAAPDVDDELAVVHDRHAGADVGPGVDVRRQHVVHAFVTRRHGPLYVCHVVPPSATAIVARTCWTWQVDVSSLFTELFGRIPPLARAAVDTTDVTVLTTSPEPGANTIAWLVWHLARVQDHHVAELLDTDQIWVGGDWAERFGLAPDPSNTGYGHSAEEMAEVQPRDRQDLLDYLDAVMARTNEMLRALQPDDLDRVVDRRWDPPVTLGVRLVSIADDSLQHAGQAAYVRGLFS